MLTGCLVLTEFSKSTRDAFTGLLRGVWKWTRPRAARDWMERTRAGLGERAGNRCICEYRHAMRIVCSYCNNRELCIKPSGEEQQSQWSSWRALMRRTWNTSNAKLVSCSKCQSVKMFINRSHHSSTAKLAIIPTLCACVVSVLSPAYMPLSPPATNTVSWNKRVSQRANCPIRFCARSNCEEQSQVGVASNR